MAERSPRGEGGAAGGAGRATRGRSEGRNDRSGGPRERERRRGQDARPHTPEPRHGWRTGATTRGLGQGRQPARKTKLRGARMAEHIF